MKNGEQERKRKEEKKRKEKKRKEKKVKADGPYPKRATSLPLSLNRTASAGIPRSL